MIKKLSALNSKQESKLIYKAMSKHLRQSFGIPNGIQFIKIIGYGDGHDNEHALRIWVAIQHQDPCLPLGADTLPELSRRLESLLADTNLAQIA